MERAYFELRHKYPAKEEYAYFRLAFQSRYPDKSETEIHKLASGCRSLDDAILAAVAVDFGHHVAARTRMDVLWNLPPCSRCGKYRALSTVDNLCYGCRKFPGFAACTKCRLYWDDYPRTCRQCGSPVWRITDGPGVPIIPLGQGGQGGAPVDGGSGGEGARHAGPMGMDKNPSQALTLASLAPQMEDLEKRCAAVWDASLRDRRLYRELRRVDPQAAREFARGGASPAETDTALIGDLDSFLDAITSLYLEADAEGRDAIRTLMWAHKRLLGNIHGYAARAARKLEQSGNPECLLRGIASVSIDDNKSSQDFGFVLGRLYGNAVERGLRPSDFFSVVAKLSTDETRAVLEGFESSPNFAVFVGPYVNKRKL